MTEIINPEFTHIDFLINNFKNFLSENNKLILSDDDLEKIKIELNESENLLNSLDSDIYSLISIITNTDLNDPDEINKCNDYINLLQSFKNVKTLTMTEEQKELILNDPIINKIINSYKEKINENEAKLNKSKNNSDLLILGKEILESLKKAKDNKEYIDCLDKINIYFKNSHEIDLRIKAKFLEEVIMHNMTISNLKKSKIADALSDIVNEIDNYILSDDELIEIWHNFGYDFTKINKNIQEKIKMHGNKNNITQIFTFFKENNINYTEANKKLNVILYKSDMESINKVMDSLKGTSITINFVIENTPTVLIHKTTSKSHNPSENLDGTSSDEIYGSLEDYLENKKLIESVGYNFEECYKKCPTLFIMPSERLSSNINILKQFYGIDVSTIRAKYDFNLYGLASPTIAKTLDRFIELDELQYVLNNSSRLNRQSDDLIFFRLYSIKKKIKESGIPDDKKIYTRSSENKKTHQKYYVYRNMIADENNPETGITKNNRYQKTSTIKPQIYGKETEEKIYELINETDILSINLIIDNQIKFLDDNFRSSDLTYKIGNMIISRQKVIRIYSILKDKFADFGLDNLLLFSISYDTLMTIEEFNKIKDEIKNKSNKLKGDIWKIS